MTNAREHACELRHRFRNETGVIYSVGTWAAMGMSGYGIMVEWDLLPTGRVGPCLMWHAPDKRTAEAVLDQLFWLDDARFNPCD